MNNAEILAALRASFKQETISLAGQALVMREMTAAQRDAYEQSMVAVDAKGNRTVTLTNYKARLVAQCIVDEACLPRFCDGELADAPASVIDPLFAVAQRLNGMGVEPGVAEGN